MTEIVFDGNLQEALSSPKVRPGDRLLLKGGTYAGDFVCGLSGDAKRITVMSYPGEWAVIDGSLQIIGENTTFSELEICYTGWRRRDEAEGANEAAIKSIYLNGTNNALTSCIIHDMRIGMYSGRDGVGSVMSGCLSYNNGYAGTVRGYGHGAYAMNRVGARKRIANNIFCGGFAYGIHCYDEVPECLTDIDITGNISFESGVLSGFSPRSNVLLGGYNVIAKNCTISGNQTYHSKADGYENNLGYGGGADGVVLADNYMPDGLTKSQVVNVSETGNYYDMTDRVGIVQVSPLRLHVAIYNPSLSNSVLVDVSKYFKDGDTLTVHNAQDYFGDIRKLTVDGGRVEVVMAGTVAAPVAWSSAPSTFPKFGAFVMERQ